MHNSDVGEYCQLFRVIVDANCSIPSGLTIGVDKAQDKANGFRVSEKGITLVTSEMLKKLAKKKSLELQYA